MSLLCLFAFSAACAAALLFTPPVRLLAERLDFLDRPGAYKQHARPVPYGGGLVVLLAVVVALLVVRFLAGRWEELGLSFSGILSLPAAETDLPRKLLFVLGGAGFMAAVGLWDDRRPLSPATKFLLQIAAAGAVVFFGDVYVTALVGDTWYMRAATVFWLVLLTNSFNFLDNMDGLCAGTAAVSAGTLCLITPTASQWPTAAAAAAVVGACVGFLRYNVAPAKIFLGDTGSLFLGFLLAGLSVTATYYRYHGSVLGLGIPLLVFALPLYDTVSVVVLRLRRGRPPWQGDRSHFSHRLTDLGLTPREATATLILAALAVALPATALGELSRARGLLIIGQALLVLTLIALLERAGHKARSRRKDNEQTPD